MPVGKCWFLALEDRIHLCRRHVQNEACIRSYLVCSIICCLEKRHVNREGCRALYQHNTLGRSFFSVEDETMAGDEAIVSVRWLRKRLGLAPPRSQCIMRNVVTSAGIFCPTSTYHASICGISCPSCRIVQYTFHATETVTGVHVSFP